MDVTSAGYSFAAFCLVRRLSRSAVDITVMVRGTTRQDGYSASMGCRISEVWGRVVCAATGVIDGKPRRDALTTVLHIKIEHVLASGVSTNGSDGSCGIYILSRTT